MKTSLLNRLFELFKARTDQIGTVGKKAYSKVVRQVSEVLDLLQQHLEGKARLGFYNLLPNGTCPWAVVEFEDHGKAGDLQDPDEKSKAFMEHMESVGITCYREMSKNPNGRCFHVWIFFEKPMSAKKVHLALKSFVNTAMAEKGTGLV
jgi:hypothetical protein